MSNASNAILIVDDDDDSPPHVKVKRIPSVSLPLIKTIRRGILYSGHSLRIVHFHSHSSSDLSASDPLLSSLSSPDFFLMTVYFSASSFNFYPYCLLIGNASNDFFQGKMDYLIREEGFLLSKKRDYLRGYLTLIPIETRRFIRANKIRVVQLSERRKTVVKTTTGDTPSVTTDDSSL